MTTTMTPDLYVHQALKILGEGLEPHIRAVMAPHLGELEWIQVLRILDEARGKYGYTYATHDVALQLRMVTERLGDIGFPFSATDKHRTLSTYGGVLRLVRNQVAHNSELSVLDALRAVDTVRIVLMFIVDEAGVDRITELRRQVIDELVLDYGPEETDTHRDPPAPTPPTAPTNNGGDDVPAASPETAPEDPELDEEVDVQGRIREGGSMRPQSPRSLTWEAWEVEVVGEPEMLESLMKVAHRESVRGAIELVAEAEGPVHQARLVTLVCQAHGARRATAAKRKKVEKQIEKSPVHVDTDGFVWPLGLDVDRWLLARRSTPAQRKIEEVSPVEIANALEVILARRGSLPRDEAKREVLQFFGRSKTSSTANQQIERALTVAQQRGRVVQKRDRLVSRAVPA